LAHSDAVDPIDAAVISVTQLEAGNAYNIIPEAAKLRGTVRTLSADARLLIEKRITAIATDLCAAFGARCSVSYERGYPVLVNSTDETEQVVSVAGAVAGADNVEFPCKPTMGSEDFAFMLEKRPGCYIFIGNGDDDGAAMVHNAMYDFNDGIIELGVTYWCTLAETLLPRSFS
jgi:hippurate hydrolase